MTAEKFSKLVMPGLDPGIHEEVRRMLIAERQTQKIRR
jgi:hypothetical protein